MEIPNGFTSAPVLSVRGLKKQFGAFTALDQVDFDIVPGEVHALLGINGAGKSTLIKILSGLLTADSGEITVGGDICKFSSARDAHDTGISAVQQHPELVDNFTVLENIFLGQETANHNMFSWLHKDANRDEAKRLMERYPLKLDLDAKLYSLGKVEKEIVAILHALKNEDTKILILDEPTSTLTNVEKAELFEAVKVLKASGVAVIYITHHLEEVYEIADRFTVMRGGKIVKTLTTAEARASDISIPLLMLNQELDNIYPAPTDHGRQLELVFSARSLTQTGKFHDISFDVCKGEIVGLFGLVGSGADELSKCLFGVSELDAGELQLAGRKVSFKNPREALDHGVFLVPGDRKSEGLVGRDNTIFNTTLSAPGRSSNRIGIKRFRRNSQDVKKLAARVELDPLDLGRRAENFSGGNQQKIVLTKALFRGAALYILVDPTVGVDIGARSKIYSVIRELTKDAGVLLISHDCDEVHGLCDRTAAMFKGRLMSKISADLSRDDLLATGTLGASS